MLPYTLPVEINGRQYTAELSEYTRRTIPRLREPFDTSEEPGEASLHTEGFWRRSQSLFGGGAGQRFFDDPTSSRERFFFSQGIDISEEGKISLLPEVQNIFASTEFQDMHLLSISQSLYFMNGDSELWFTSNQIPDSSSDFTQVTGTPTDMTHLASDGNNVYIAASEDGIYETQRGSSSASQLTSDPAYWIGYAQGHLLFADHNNLKEVFSDGTTETIYTHDVNQFRFDVMTVSPIGIHVGGRGGDFSEIFFLTVDPETGEFNTPVPTLVLPKDEHIQTMVHYGGLLLLGTDKGIRLARISGSGALSYGPLLEISPDNIQSGVENFAPVGEFVYFTWTDYPDRSDLHEMAESHSGIGKINLALFTEPMVPVYTSHLMAPFTEACLDVAVHNGRPFFVLSNQGIFGPKYDGTKVSEGHLVTGWIRYGTVEDKTIPRVDVAHLNTDGTIEGHLHTIESATSVPLVIDADKTTDHKTVFRGTTDADIEVGERVNMHLTLKRDSQDATKGPIVNRWTMRAFVSPNRLEEVIVPLIISDNVTAQQPGGSPVEIPMDSLEEFQFLNGLVGTGEAVDYREGGTTYRAYIDQISVSPRGWNSDFTHFNGLIMVRLIIREAQQ